VTNWDNNGGDFELSIKTIESNDGGNGIDQGSINVLMNDEFPIKPVIKMNFPGHLYLERHNNDLITKYSLSGRDVQITVLFEVLTDWN
jgi:hypothetical protein|tara:strand:- start:377 stop:640 length:264 start_codon:yes stop_codon:yes gene_type:complete